MGCARCVVSCPTDALEIKDVRNVFNKSLVQNASYLLKQKPQLKVVREEAEIRLDSERKQDWSEINKTPSLNLIQQQASRCLDCGLPGCINACPLQNRIPEWLEQVAAGNISKAAEIAHSTSNLPEVCGTLCPQHRLCEGSCTKAKEPGGAVTIGIIERYLVENAFQQKWQPAINIKTNNKHVAVIGAGPAGLACADQLNKAGYEVAVFDKQPVIGGLLASGVPPFKMDKTLLTQRHQLLKRQGINFQLGVEVDQALLNKLLRTHDAIFLGTGTQTSRDLKLPGQQLAGVTDALSYLQQVNRELDPAAMTGKHVLILGGGDSAMDSARSAVRQGATEVTIAYRRDEQAMRASPKEKQAAVEEGVRLRLECKPVTVLGDKFVTGVCFSKPDGTGETIHCDALVFAVGQIPRPPAWLNNFNIQTNAQGIIQVDGNGRTSNPEIYAGGDNTHGPDLVVTAIAAGRKAAAGIEKNLTSRFGFNKFYKISKTTKPDQGLPLPVAAKSMT